MVSDSPERSEAPDEANEVDLWQHVFALGAWRREIGLLAVLAALGGAVFAVARGPLWQATALVAVVRTHADVALTSRLPSDLEESVSSARRTAFLQIAGSVSVANAVADAMGDRLDADERDPDRLLDAVSIHTGNTLAASDLIAIDAMADGRAKAVALADAWATILVREANRLYSGVPDESATGTALTTAEEAYAVAQGKLEEFIAGSEIRTLNHQIRSHEIVLESRLAELAEREALRRRQNELLADANGLRAHIEASGDVGRVTNSLALMRLKAEVFTSTPENPLDFVFDSFSALDISTAQQIADLDAMIRMLRERAAPTAATIADSLSPGDGRPGHAGTADQVPRSSRDGVAQSLRRLLAKREALEATRVQLVAERDIQRTALRVLKEAHLQTSLNLPLNSILSEVRLASLASLPHEPESRGVLLAAGVGALGLLAGMILALGANALGVRPWFGRRA